LTRPEALAGRGHSWGETSRSAGPEEYADRRLRLAPVAPAGAGVATIVIRQGSAWQSLAFLFLCLLLIAVVLLGQYVLRGLDAKDQQAESALARAERKLQALESGMSYDARPPPAAARDA
jgi:hypothetical protein